MTLFAADAIAERLGATRPKRFWLAAAGATALWSVTVRWGHPEDAVAIGLLLYAILALADSRTSRSAWLAGAAVAVQPLVLLAFPLLAAVVEPRRLAGYVARAAAPGALLLAAAAAANWTATVHAVTSQPNYPAIDHPTPWIYLAPHLPGGQVAAGPGQDPVHRGGLRMRAGRRAPLAGGAAGPGRWGHEALTELLWWSAVTLAIRSAFEPVMVSYYLWPPLAVALAAAARDWSRLLPTGCAAVVLTFFSQVQWRNPWSWWTPMVAGLVLALYFARARGSAGAAPQVLPEPGEQFAADGAP